MESESLISVIIPFYNIGDYIKKTVQSLESQTYKKFEVIFVNDGSTDRSLKILKAELKEVTFDYKIIILPENKGLSNARNRGVSSSKGEYIYFLDADDYLENNAFEKVMEMFKAHNTDAVFFQFKRVDENGNVLKNYNESFKDVNKIESSRDILFKYINLEIFICSCSIVYRKKTINNLFFNEISYIEDQDFNIRALINSNKVGYINSQIFNYCQREGSLMNRKFNLNILDKIKLFDIFYQEYEVKDKELSELFLKRRAKEVLWITRAYIKEEKKIKAGEIKKYIEKNFPSLYVRIVQTSKINRKNLIRFKRSAM
ncbi:glycosyltransferase family 2 protein [Ilyobacter polytropus]|uniref:Glycosyl transferase family 2 n=1 Tax=Ilyobacter polytropus (strain ATCC 51220 / DSM 2926 / LMG 16218 / CuHBu1) TaxID=572544 RepID=E3H7B6_ILYPC|nr:glycosyltransferase family 2 protein [Ilyobacter polytropus]ADO82597.1 glycosyl transferase family 2 [Ilyobacter polytropus DSM 2926]